MKKLLLAALTATFGALAAGPSIPPVVAQLFSRGTIVHVANNTALLQAPASAARVFRDGYATAGDGGGAPYTWNAAACTLNSGAGDNGSQVPALGGGCWKADLTSMRATPAIWSCRGDGATDDTSCMQAAIAATTAANVPLYINKLHLISSGLSSAGRPYIEGINANLTIYSTSCPSGLVANTNLTALTLTGPTATIRNLCIQMASTAGTRGSGAAIAVGAPAGTQQGHAVIAGNTIIFPYDGITVGGATTGATQTNSDLIADNIIISPSHYGISNGQNSTGNSTNGTTFRDNQIYCGSANANATGVALFDGAVQYYGADGGPYQCKVGLQIAPSTGQTMGGGFSGVLGDSSLTHDLVVGTSGGGTLQNLRFTGTWTSSVAAGDQSVLINGTAGGGLTFVGAEFYSSGGNPTTLNIAAGSNVTISGSQFYHLGGSLTQHILLGATASNVAITGNQFFTSNGGTTTNDISITAGANIFAITGNMLTDATTPLNYTPASETATIANNMGLSNVESTVASATSISFPNSEKIFISGIAAIQTIANSGWSNRLVTLIPTGAFSFTTGGNLCNTVTVTTKLPILAMFDAGGSCWALK